MARWQLIQPHYLSVVGNTWEYVENDRTTGKPRRTQFKVPMLLDPEDSTSWTHKEFNQLGQPIEGTIVVCWEGKGEAKDLVFEGEPTPDMRPLDDEAKKISAELAPRWKTPVGIESDRGYVDVILRTLETQMDKVQQTAGGNQLAGMDKLLAAMTAMMEQNQQLIAAFAGNAKANAAEGRRV